MKQTNGFWVPDSYKSNFLFKNGTTRSGLPTYAVDQITKCIETCILRRKAMTTAIDGGAFVGSWSVHLAKVFTHVIAFEPNDANFDCLLRNVDTLVNVKPVYGALSSKSGMMVIEPDAKPWSHRVRTKTAEDGHKHNTPATALDDMMLDYVDFIKLDVEGHEHDALQGAAETIKRCRPVVMIEEKFDKKKQGTQLLESLGMEMIWSKKHDYLFAFPLVG